jgi:predicted transcriptional regulator
MSASAEFARGSGGARQAPEPSLSNIPRKEKTVVDGTSIERNELLALTTAIVSAHIGNNSVEPTELPALIQTVFKTLRGLASKEPAGRDGPTPAVPLKRSVTDDYIVCLEDGRKLKMLKRHLMTAYDMTPEQYRAKWGLKPDYPMVAPSYAARRSELALKIGLGRRPRFDAMDAAPTGRGRRKAAV